MAVAWLRRRIWLKRAGALLVAGALQGLPGRRASAQGTEPDAAVRRIRAFCDALLDVMKQAERLGVQGRYDRLAPVIRQTFDLEAMTRIAVGPGWRTIPADLQKALVDGFSRMTVATYANRFNGYSGERFEVDPQSAERSTGRVVRTKLVPASGEPVAARATRGRSSTST